MASHVRLGLVAVVTLPWYGKAGAASAFSKGSEPPAAEQRARPVPLTARAKTISTPWSTRLSQGSWFVGDEDTWAALHQVGHLTLKPAQGAAVQGRLSAKKLGEPRDWAVGEVGS